MKKLAVLLAIIFLPPLTFFQYQSYKRFRPAVDYDYAINDGIDYNYYNPRTVQDYVENTLKVGNYARSQWFSKDIDVRFPNDEKPEELKSAEHYDLLVTTTKLLEAKLLLSTKLKQEGFNNNEILEIEKSGLSPSNYYYQKKSGLLNLQIGQAGSQVYEVQNILIAKGYDIPHDGVFGAETETALKDYQTQNQLFSSGILDEKTLKSLIK